MLQMLNDALTEIDELIAQQPLSFLTEKWPDLQVSIPAIKFGRKKIGWVCTRPHYCQMLRDISVLIDCIFRVCYL